MAWCVWAEEWGNMCGKWWRGVWGGMMCEVFVWAEGEWWNVWVWQ